jgi:glycosyltransferase involved in cell wall biosynthesis
MDRNPKFSAVTSFFGEGEKYVKRLYADLKSQNVDFEWVVTDDFSGDKETELTLRSLADLDPAVKYVEQKSKREIYRDPQKYCTGEFVFHIDADDRVHPNYLQHCQYWFERFPLVNCILCGSEWVLENGKFNRFHYHTREDVFSQSKHNFIGRVWRNGFDFKFREIFSNYDDVIRMNDMFVVKSFETVGDILCLPRVYVRYEMRATSNSTIKRSPIEVEKIERCANEFFSWLRKNLKESPYDPFFFESESDVVPFLALKWETDKKTIHYCGKPMPPHRRRKVRELYKDFSITMGNWVSGQDPDYRIINCSSSFKKFPLSSRGNIIVCHIDDEECFNYYQQQLLSKGLIFRWINLWDYKWMITL